MPSRRWLYDYMSDRGYSPAIQQWLGSNLVPNNGSGFKWAFNISGNCSLSALLGQEVPCEPVPYSEEEVVLYVRPILLHQLYIHIYQRLTHSGIECVAQVVLAYRFD